MDMFELELNLDGYEYILYAPVEVVGGLLKVYKKNPWWNECWRDLSSGECIFSNERNAIYISPTMIKSAENIHEHNKYSDDKPGECVACILKTWEDAEYYVPNWWRTIAYTIKKSEETE